MSAHSLHVQSVEGLNNSDQVQETVSLTYLLDN